MVWGNATENAGDDNNNNNDNNNDNDNDNIGSGATKLSFSEICKLEEEESLRRRAVKERKQSVVGSSSSLSLSEEEQINIAMALSLSDASELPPPPLHSKPPPFPASNHIPSEEDYDKSFALALELEEEERLAKEVWKQNNRHINQNGSSRVQVAYSKSEAGLGVGTCCPGQRELFGADDYEKHNAKYTDDVDVLPRNDYDNHNARNRSNSLSLRSFAGEQEFESNFSSKLEPTATRGLYKDQDGNFVSKHDPVARGMRNASKILNSSDLKNTDSTLIGDAAYNNYTSKHKKMTGNRKGVARSGTGRAERMGGGKTHEGVLDGDVRMLLQKEINLGECIDVVGGIISEGKEGVVVYGEGGLGPVAIKVFKRIQKFENRSEYVVGDFRYRNEGVINSRNSRATLNEWCEKEYRNLKRCRDGGCAVPVPIKYKANVLVMEFLGEEGWAYPTLKQVGTGKKNIKVGSDIWLSFFLQLMVSVKRIYHCAELVHADLSEFNVLVVRNVDANGDDDEGSQDAGCGNGNRREMPMGKNRIVVIDFATGVPVGHERAEEFLKKDIGNVRTFFYKMLFGHGEGDFVSVERLLEFVKEEECIRMGIENESDSKQPPDAVVDKHDQLVVDRHDQHDVLPQERTVENRRKSRSKLFDNRSEYFKLKKMLK